MKSIRLSSIALLFVLGSVLLFVLGNFLFGGNVKGTVEVTPSSKFGPSSTQPPAKPAWAATVEKDAQDHYADLPIDG